MCSLGPLAAVCCQQHERTWPVNSDHGRCWRCLPHFKPAPEDSLQRDAPARSRPLSVVRESATESTKLIPATGSGFENHAKLALIFRAAGHSAELHGWQSGNIHARSHGRANEAPVRRAKSNLGDAIHDKPTNA